MRKLKDYVLEGCLIIFSVLFALFLENYYQNIKIQQQKKLALERIRMELSRNAKILSEWIPDHRKIYNHLNKPADRKNDSLKNVLIQYDFFNLDLILDNKQLINNVLTNTAWETAKSTGIISEFDFELTEQLTQVYSLQDVAVNVTIHEILEVLMDQETHEIRNLDASIKQLEIRFRELTGQERFLMNTYDASLKKLM